jgi:hypothetical protein
MQTPLICQCPQQPFVGSKFFSFFAWSGLLPRLPKCLDDVQLMRTRRKQFQERNKRINHGNKLKIL